MQLKKSVIKLSNPLNSLVGKYLRLTLQTDDGVAAENLAYTFRKSLTVTTEPAVGSDDKKRE